MVVGWLVGWSVTSRITHLATKARQGDPGATRFFLSPGPPVWGSGTRRLGKANQEQ